MNKLAKDRQTVLAVGMMPPPIGGQSLMFETAILELKKFTNVDIIDLQVQVNIGSSGSLSCKKIFDFLKIFYQCLRLKTSGVSYDILYYCPSGPSTFGLAKDIILLYTLRKISKKTVYHFHATGGIQALLNKNRAFQWCAQRAIWSPTLSIRCADVQPNDALLCDSEKVSIVWNGIPDPRAHYDESWQWRPPSTLTMTFVGVLTEDKGVFDIIRIAKELKARGVEFKINLVGEGSAEEVEKIDYMITENHLTGSVSRLGVLTGKSKFDVIGNSTFFLFPTFFRAETQPLAVIEALGMGVPAIVSNWRGLSTIVKHNHTGLLLPPKEPTLFAKAIIESMNSPKLLSMSENARRTFIENFSLDRFRSNFSATISSLLN